MDILYCGDSKVIDGIMISVLSVAKNCSLPIRVFVLTMDFALPNGKKFKKIEKSKLLALEKEIKKKNQKSEILVYDAGELFKKNPATANKRTFFTPYCMLRLYADKISELPDKILYLDTDVVCLNDPSELLDLPMEDYEMAGVLDRYGSKLIRWPLGRKKYINSGVLLLNLKKIKETGLFDKALRMCKVRPMIMPDQSALNFCAKYKKIIETKYNDQKEICTDTVFRHFSNTFKFWPIFKVQAIKPWQIAELHTVLNTHEFDDVLEKYQQLRKETK